MDLQKMQKNPIFRILVDILQNTNFFRAFTASADVPSIYVQQFWNTLGKDTKTGITPKDSTHPFVPRPASDLIIDFVKGRDYLGDIQHNIHRRPQSPVHITTDDYPLNYLKFVSKGEVDEIFGMPIPKDLIIDAIRNSDYYKKYWHGCRKPRQPDYYKRKLQQPTPSIEKSTREKRSGPSCCEKDEGKSTCSEPQVEDDEYNLKEVFKYAWKSIKGAKKLRSEDKTCRRWSIHDLLRDHLEQLPVVKARGKDASTGPSSQPQDDTSANVVHDTPSPADYINDAETIADMEQSNSETDTEILYVEEEHGEKVSNTVALEEKAVELDEGQAGSDPGKTPESRPPPERKHMEEDQAGSDLGQSYVAQARPNPKPMHKDFIATVYPKVHESLKLTVEEHVYIENPPSSTMTLSLMKNL
ncbi:hypothetical protein Tco_1306606 [Tanacetum coccineum]